jgi:hypothetical protein
MFIYITVQFEMNDIYIPKQIVRYHLIYKVDQLSPICYVTNTAVFGPILKGDM